MSDSYQWWRRDSGFFAVGKTARLDVVGRPTTNFGTPGSAEASFTKQPRGLQLPK